MHAESPRTTVYVAIKRGMDARGFDFWLDHNFLICMAIFGIKGYNSNTLLTAPYLRNCIRLGEG